MDLKKITLSLFLIVAMQSNLQAQFWNLVWADEFNGSTIDASNWTMEIGTGSSGWGNNEWQFYTARPENASIQNGHLAIVAKKESYAGSNYTSARMITQGKQSWKYGKIEARIKFPSRQGIWPAFWMLGNSFSTVGWPKCGEIDIMEHINTSDKIHGTIHWDANGYATYGGDVTLSNVADFHTYAIEWDASSIRWFVDGNQYHVANILNGINSTAEFHEEFFIILNMAVGGNWPGYPNPSDAINDTLLVDYVRVYQDGLAPTSVDAINLEQSVAVYPNPVKTNSSFQIPGDYAPGTRIDLIDPIGRICTTKILENKLEEVTIETRGLPAGIYFLQIANDELQRLSKVLITE